MKTSFDTRHHNTGRPARYRPTLWAGVHYLLWNLLFLILWPVSWIIHGIEKICRHD